jgi:hypothetical protein
VQDDEPRRIGVWKRPQEHAIDDGENGHVRSQPEPERQDRDDRKAGRLDERAQTVANVLNQVFNSVDAPRVATFFLQLIQTPEFQTEPAAGVIR